VLLESQRWPSDCAAQQEQRNTTAGKRAHGFSCTPNPNSRDYTVSCAPNPNPNSRANSFSSTLNPSPNFRANSFSCTLNPSPNSLKALPFEGLIYRYPEVVNCPDPAISDTRLLDFCFSNFTTLPVAKKTNKKLLLFKIVKKALS